MKKIACAFGLVGALCASSVFAWGKDGESKITFLASGPAGLKINGEGTKLDVKDDGKKIELTVALKDVDTGMGLRNKHMGEDLEADKFPNVSLSVPTEALKGFEDGKKFSGTAKGTIALHGKTKEVPFKYDVECKAGVCNVNGSADLNLKDYEIKIRSYMGITVKPEVSIGASFKLKK
jgi:polyisoprenoid-binding protein YceI